MEEEIAEIEQEEQAGERLKWRTLLAELKQHTRDEERQDGKKE